MEPYRELEEAMWAIVYRWCEIAGPNSAIAQAVQRAEKKESRPHPDDLTEYILGFLGTGAPGSLETLRILPHGEQLIERFRRIIKIRPGSIPHSDEELILAVRTFISRSSIVTENPDQPTHILVERTAMNSTSRPARGVDTVPLHDELRDWMIDTCNETLPLDHRAAFFALSEPFYEWGHCYITEGYILWAFFSELFDFDPWEPLLNIIEAGAFTLWEDGKAIILASQSKGRRR